MKRGSIQFLSTFRYHVSVAFKLYICFILIINIWALMICSDARNYKHVFIRTEIRNMLGKASKGFLKSYVNLYMLYKSKFSLWTILTSITHQLHVIGKWVYHKDHDLDKFVIKQISCMNLVIFIKPSCLNNIDAHAK